MGSVEIHTYRARIGLFHGGTKCKQTVISPAIPSFGLSSKQTHLASMTCFRLCFIITGILLVMSGNIERNPGPTGTRLGSVTHSKTGTKGHNSHAASSDPTMSEILHAIQTGHEKVDQNFIKVHNELSELKEQIQNCKCEELTSEIHDLKSENKFLRAKLNSVGDKSKHKNLIFINVPEEDQEITEDIVRKRCYDDFKVETALEDDTCNIERSYRLGKPKLNHSRPIFVQFCRLKHRMSVLDAFRKFRKNHSSDTYIRVKEDFCEDVRIIRQKLFPCLQKAKDWLSDPTKASLRHDKIWIKGRKLSFSIDNECLIALDRKAIPTWLAGDSETSEPSETDNPL